MSDIAKRFRVLLLLLMFPSLAQASEIRITVKVDYDNHAPAAGLQVTVREQWLDGVTPRTSDYEIGKLDAQGQLNNAFVRNRRQHTVKICGGFPPKCHNEDRDLPNDVPALTVMVRHPTGPSHNHPLVAAYGRPLIVEIKLPPHFSSGLLNPQAVNHIMRRRNLNTDFNEDQQKQLANLVAGHLTPDVIAKHGREIDHIGNLFSDHRSYIYEMEKKLIANGAAEFVPMPIWEPISELPPLWNQVKPVPEFTAPFLDTSGWRLLPRPQLPQELRPERMCSESFNTAQDLALKFGRTGPSAPTSYHLASHAMLAGPFLSMSTASAGVIFWPYHSLLVDLYDKWLSCKFGTKPGLQVENYHQADGTSRMGLFRIGLDNKLWHSYERLTAVRHNDLDHVTEQARPVTFDHWSHWVQIDFSKDITRVKVVQAKNATLVALATGSDNRLFSKVGFDEAWSSWRDLQTEVRDYVAVLGADEKVEIIAIRRNGSGFELVTAKETTAGRGDFGAFARQSDINPGPGMEVLIHEGRPYVFFANNQARLHALLKRPDGTWGASEELSNEPVRNIQAGHGADGRVEVFVTRSDDQVYGRARYIRLDGTIAWADWSRIGFKQVNGLKVGNNQDGRLSLLAQGVDGKIWYASQTSANGPFSGWTELPQQELIARADTSSGQRIARLVGVLTDRDGKLRVFVQGRDGFMYMAEQTTANGVDWIGWTSL